jgi:hypothetical protein
MAVSPPYRPVITVLFTQRPSCGRKNKKSGKIVAGAIVFLTGGYFCGQNY